MSPALKALLAGIVVSGGCAFSFGVLESAARSRGSHAESSSSNSLVPLLMGGIAAFLTYQLSGNRKTARASREQRDAVLRLQPATGTAQLFVFREGFVGRAVGMNISVDGRQVAQIKGGCFTCIEVTPGPHRIGVAFGGLSMGGQTETAVDLEFPGGGVVAVSPKVTRGMVSSTLAIEREQDLEVVKRKLSGMPMVVPDAPPAAAMPPA